MSARILFSAFTLAVSILLFSFSHTTFSQDEFGIPKMKENSGQWSIGYYASGNLSLINDYTRKKDLLAGYGGVLEFTYNNPHTQLLFLVGKDRINSPADNEYFETLEFTLGPRFNLNRKGDLFTEFTAGGLLLSRSYKPDFWEYFTDYYLHPDPIFRIGVTGAFGKKFALNKNTDIILKLRALTAISFENDNITYITLNGGVVFNTKPVKQGGKKRISYVAIGAFCGGNNPGFLSQWRYNWGINYGGEISYKTSPRVEFNLAGNYNRVIKDQISTVDKASFTSVTLGGRFYVNASPASAFIEFNGGIYSYRVKNIEPYAGYDYTDEFGGITAGTGIKFEVNSYFDVLLKTAMNLLFNDTSADIPNFISVKGGLRFNL